MTAPVLPDAGTDPARYVLAVADVREARAKAATPSPWTNKGYAAGEPVPYTVDMGPQNDVRAPYATCHGNNAVPNAEHIAAEANPAHALAEVALWRGVAERHVGVPVSGQDRAVVHCQQCWSGYDLVTFKFTPWPCPDLLAVVAACQAYAGGMA